MESSTNFNQSYGNSSNSMASERLKKAIERNRRKQTRNMSGSASRLKKKTVETSATRRSVAKANDNVEFVNLRSRTTARTAGRASARPATPSYSRAKATPATRRRRRTKKAVGIHTNVWLVRASWIFCTFLLARLIFSAGGMIDYYSNKSALEQKVRDLSNVKIENQSLLIEIEDIKNSRSYQKKLVRDHLGFIAKDEFLILFQK